MSLSTQEFIATSTIRAAQDLEKALLELPEEKRAWKASPASRSALNMVAECAVMAEATISMIQTGAFPSEAASIAFRAEITALADDWPKLQALLHENTAKVAEAIRAVPDEALLKEFVLPWETITMSTTMSYPYWNMSYHMGQINFIAGILDTPN